MRIGIDLGGTKSEAVRMDAEGAVRARLRRPTPRARGYEAIVENLVDLVRVLEDGTGPLPVGLGMPGIVDRRSGRVKNANTTCLNDRRLQEDLETALGRPVQIHNDANCFALAEARAGAGRGCGVVFGVILGTGVGGGICLGERIHDGPQQIAGEWGHAPIHLGPDDLAALSLEADTESALLRRCYCGQWGCVETRLSGPGLARDAHDLGVPGLEHAEDAAGVFRAAHGGEPSAVQAVDRWYRFLGLGLARVLHLLDPDVVVLGGGLSNELDPVRVGASVQPHLFNTTLLTPIRANELGDSAGVLGAAWLAAGDGGSARTGSPRGLS